MILQNKQTGVLGVLEATTYHGGRPDNIVEVYEMGMGAVRVLAQYNTLEELLKEWEDYKPAEPLIKDAKIRKAVRAWAEALYLKGAIFDFNDETMMLRSGKRGDNISFGGLDFCEFKHITAGYHTIAELCGEGGKK